MKTLLALLVALALCGSRAEAALTRITGCANTQSGIAADPSCAVTTGATNRVILVFSGNANVLPTATISDTAGNTWTALRVKFTQAGSGAGYAWWALANGTGSTTITIDWSSNPSSFDNVLVDVFDGNDTSSPISASNDAVAATGAPSGTVTPLDNNCLLWGAANDSITAVGSGYTKGADDAAQDWSEYKVIAGGSGAGQTVNFSGTSGAWMLVMAAVKPATGGVACAPTLTLMGVSRSCGDE